MISTDFELVADPSSPSDRASGDQNAGYALGDAVRLVKAKGACPPRRRSRIVKRFPTGHTGSVPAPTSNAL